MLRDRREGCKQSKPLPPTTPAEAPPSQIPVQPGLSGWGETHPYPGGKPDYHAGTHSPSISSGHNEECKCAKEEGKTQAGTQHLFPERLCHLLLILMNYFIDARHYVECFICIITWKKKKKRKPQQNQLFMAELREWRVREGPEFTGSQRASGQQYSECRFPQMIPELTIRSRGAVGPQGAHLFGRTWRGRFCLLPVQLLD